jgi:hypothetical protein
LTSSLQAFLLQLQSGQNSAGTNAAGVTTNVNASATGTTQTAPSDRHRSVAGEAGGPSQLKADATSLLSDLTGKTNSSGSGASSTDAASSTTGTSADASNGISAQLFGAFRGYVGSGRPDLLPTQLGFA